LTGGVAHDFNNLLLIAHGNLELLNDALEAGKSNLGEFVGRAQQAVLRGAELTRRLLAFARSQPFKAFPIDLNGLVSELVPLMSHALGEDVHIDTTLQEGLATVMVDRSQVENALLNLAVNARDAMPRGGRLTIATRHISIDDARPADLPAQDYVCLSVSDTGSGMRPEVRDRAFEPFFTTKPTGKGTGLGLSMIYGFARESGGGALLASEPGQGTTVSIYLPSAKTDAPSEVGAHARAGGDVDGTEV
jgi:signal transduction histidine kinase